MNRAFSASTRGLLTIPGAMPQAESEFAPMALIAIPSKRPLQKVVSLFFADWFFEWVEHLHHVLPDFPFLGGGLVP